MPRENHFPRNHWRWLRRWDPRAQQAIDWACRQFPAHTQHRGLVRAYYEYLWVADELLQAYPQGVAGYRVLDVGCGAGVVALALARLGARVSAVDRFDEYRNGADNQMGTAEEILARFEQNGIAAHCRDFMREGLPGEPESYDLITCLAVIEHLRESPRPVLERFRALLKPGGHLLITTPNHAWIRTRLRLLAGRSAYHPLPDWWRPEFYGHLREYTWPELEAMLRWTGFEIRRSRISNWSHASSRLRQRDTGTAETWTTRFTLDCPARWLVAASLLVTAPFPSLRYSMLAIARKPHSWVP